MPKAHSTVIINLSLAPISMHFRLWGIIHHISDLLDVGAVSSKCQQRNIGPIASLHLLGIYYTTSRSGI